MPIRRRSLHAALAAIALLAFPAAARERSEIPEKYKWNLADMYPSVQAWQQARADLQKRIGQFGRHRGHLAESAAALRAGLDDYFGIDRDLNQLGTYAFTLSDEDTRAGGPRELKQAATQLGVDFGAASAFVRPEIVQLDPAKVKAWVAQEKGLAPYRFFLEDALRWKPHTLTPGEERIVAEAGNLDTSGETYGILANADLPFPTVKLSTGQEVRMDASAFTLHRADPVREDRDKAFQAHFGALQQFERTFGTTLYGQVKAHEFTAKARGFDSALSAALFPDAIPTAVYRQLVSDVRRSLPTLHRYLKLRQRMLGVDQLRYQDLYVPIVGKIDMSFDPEQGRKLTLDAVAPLGPEYQAGLKKGFEERWTDFLPSTGKRSGAYSTGVYGLHPYQLLNYNGKYEDVSTLAHESGHSMHTWLSMRAQPYPTFNYATFVAEVASTLNENLLLHHMLGQAKDDRTRLFLLGTYLDGFRTTLFRQTQFAEFELAIHEAVERGETLTGENLTERYLKLVREYYGHDQKICRVDDVIGAEWAYIPHFYRNFYVFQYATSLVASTSLAKAIRDEAPSKQTARRDAYLNLLRAGGSDYPVQLLKQAGVDMTTSKPFDAAIAEMNALMDEMEKILARQPAEPAAPAR